MTKVTTYQRTNLIISLLIFSGSGFAYYFRKKQAKPQDQEKSQGFYFPNLKYLQDPVKENAEPVQKIPN